MAEYIEREAVLKLFDKVGCYLNPKCLERQKEDIEKLPTADVVPVVRCKDCIHYKDEWCEILKAESPVEDGFCCYGERKIDNGKK